MEKLREINTSMTEAIQSEVIKWMKHLKSVFGKEAAESIMTIALEETWNFDVEPTTLNKRASWEATQVFYAF